MDFVHIWGNFWVAPTALGTRSSVGSQNAYLALTMKNGLPIHVWEQNASKHQESCHAHLKCHPNEREYISMLGNTRQDYRRRPKLRKMHKIWHPAFQANNYAKKVRFLCFLVIQMLKMVHEAAEKCQKKFRARSFQRSTYFEKWEGGAASSILH